MKTKRVQFTNGQSEAMQAILVDAPYGNLCSADHLSTTRITERRLFAIRHQVIQHLIGKGFVGSKKDGTGIELTDVGRAAWAVHVERWSPARDKNITLVKNITLEDVGAECQRMLEEGLLRGSCSLCKSELTVAEVSSKICSQCGPVDGLREVVFALNVH